MPTPLELLTEQRTALDTERTEIHEAAGKDDLNDEQQARWDEIDGEVRDLDEKIAAETEKEARAKRVQESRAKWGSLHVAPVEPDTLKDVRSMGRMEARDAAMKVLEDRDNTHLTDDQRSHVDRLLRTEKRGTSGDAIARRLLVTENPHYRSAFVKGVTQSAPAFTSEEARALEEFRAMSIGSDAAGGFGVPVLIDPTIILTAQGSLNPFRRISRVETITTDTWKGVSSAGVSWSHDTEAATVSDDSPTLAQPSVPVHKAQGFIPYSIEVGQDYPGFAAEMATLLSSGYDELQAQMMATGSGSDQPTGIITALDANTNVEVVTTTDGAFGAPDLTKTWAALPDRWKANATWVVSHAVGQDIAGFGSAAYLGYQTVDLRSEVEVLRNRPVEYSSYFPGSLSTTGAANILVVGDFRNYLIADRVGMTVELVPHLFDVTNNRPTGQRGWYAYARYGADSVNDLGFRLLQNQ